VQSVDEPRDGNDWDGVPMYSYAMQVQRGDVGCDCEVIGNEDKPRVRPVIKRSSTVCMPLTTKVCLGAMERDSVQYSGPLISHTCSVEQRGRQRAISRRI
jgi:hypothetical protein